MSSQKLWPSCATCHPWSCSHRWHHIEQACYWGCWTKYLKAIKVNDDPFLTTFFWGDKHWPVVGFTAAVRANDIQSDAGASTASAPVSGTIWAAIDVVAQTYSDHDFPSLIHDADGKLTYLPSSILRGYTNTYPSKKPQKVINPCVVQGLLHSTSTPEDIACGQLAGGPSSSPWGHVNIWKWLEIITQNLLRCLENLSPPSQFCLHHLDLPKEWQTLYHHQSASHFQQWTMSLQSRAGQQSSRGPYPMKVQAHWQPSTPTKTSKAHSSK